MVKRLYAELARVTAERDALQAKVDAATQYFNDDLENTLVNYDLENLLAILTLDVLAILTAPVDVEVQP
ncbi:MAG: hypothetical protein ACYCPT_13765 [Acidimicrobiales bacterium]